jgi:threonine dehydratase/serine racemase
MPEYAVCIHDVRAAAERIVGKAHRTPVVTCETIDRFAARRVFFKCEHLQKVGAFKFRGACNAVFLLSAEEARRGVVTHSSGNHAQALALAARLRGMPAHIVMPRGSAAVKKVAVEDYGARVVECEPTLEARETMAARVQEETGATFIHPYDNPHIIAGQGTAALELVDQVADLDALVVPVGGGGLLSGSCVAIRAVSAKTRIFAAEPKGADDAARSFAAGRLIPQTDPRTIADGLRTSLGELTWPIIRDHVEAVITVDEEEIVAAMRLAWERAKLLIEPSAAVALAAVLAEELKTLDGIGRLGVILSGGNVDVTALPF